MTDLEKNLIALMAHGIYLEFHSGHRYIRSISEFDETYNGYNLNEELKTRGIQLNNKIYGGVIEAITIIDSLMIKMHNYSLIEFYDTEIQVGDINSSSNKWKCRVGFEFDYENSGLN